MATILNTALGVASTELGGSGIRALRILEYLSKKHEICLLGSLNGIKHYQKGDIIFSEIMEVKEIWGDSVEHNNIFSQFLFLVSAMFRGILEMKELPFYDVVYSPADDIWDILPVSLFKKKYPDAVWVMVSHHKIPIKLNSFRDFLVSLFSLILQRISFRVFRRKGDFLFVLDSDTGDKIADFFIAKKFSQEKIYRVKDGANIDLINKVPEQKKKFEACFLGGLRPDKGMYDLVPIWRRVVKENLDARLNVIGGGLDEYVRKFKELIRKNKLERNIKPLGFIKNDIKMYCLLKQSKVFLFPSRVEGWGISVCEAMACGLPVVAWDLPIYKRIYPRGIVKIPCFDYQQFVEAVVDLLNNPVKAEQIGLEGKQLVQKYDWKNIAQEEMNIISKILQDI